MRHAAHKADSTVARRALVPAGTKKAARKHAAHRATGSALENASLALAVTNDGAVVGLDSAVAEKLNELAPQSRKAMRLAARKITRRKQVLTSASFAALLGTAATAVAMGVNQHSQFTPTLAGGNVVQVERASASEVSRDQSREELTEQSQGEGQWDLGQSNTVAADASITRAKANNPNVAALLDIDGDAVPVGFNPDHATGDTGNAYEFSQCTWWVYVRRHELGLPVGSHMGNGNMWANSARALGYWVDNTPRHVGDIMVFAAGQSGSDPVYGHVAIVEKINPDGSIVTSEMGASMQGKTYSHTYTNTADFQYIHY